MSEKKTVLLVDDDHDLVCGASARLQRAGYRTLEADNGESGVAIAAEQRPDAILLDVRMPVMDGLTALSELRNREDTKQIPVVMLSACVNTQQTALETGARFFLAKPYEGKDLVAAVDAVVSESMNEDQE